MPLVIDNIKLDRDDLAEFLPNLRAIKAFENLAKAVSSTIPDAINGNSDSVDDIALETGAAASTAISALLEAALAMATAQDANVQTLTGQVAALAAQAADLQGQIEDLKKGYLL